MRTVRTLLARWRELKRPVRGWIVAGFVASVGIVGAGISDALKDQVKGWITTLVGHTESYGKQVSCEFRPPPRPANPNKPVVLFPRFGNDPDDAAWSNVYSLLTVGTDFDFDIVPSCMRFEADLNESMQTSSGKFLIAIQPQMKAINADMLMFGRALPPLKAQIWSANFLGGCDWSNVNVIDIPAASPKEMLTNVRSALLHVIILGLIAACNRDAAADWQSVARIVDVVAPYIEEKKALLTATDYEDAQLHIFALAFSHYASSGDAPWFDRASRAINALILSSKGSEDVYKQQLLLLIWWKYKKTNSQDSLKQFVSYVRSVQQANPGLWNSLLSSNGDDVIDALQAAQSNSVADVTAEEIEQARAAITNLASSKK